MIQAAIFDLDGTLINSLPDIAASMNRALARCGLPGYSVEDYRMKVGNGVKKIAERTVGPEHMDQFNEVLALYMADYAQHCCIDSYVYPGVRDMLDGLLRRGVQVSVFSNKDQGDVESVMAHYFPGFPFAAIRGRVENTPLKPAPDGARMIADQLGLPHDAFLYVGDSKMDMLCGNAAQMHVVGVSWGFRSREELQENNAHFIIDDPNELLSICDRLNGR